MKRIRRLLHQPEGPRVSFVPVLSAAVLTIAAAVALTAWQALPAAPATPEVDNLPLHSIWRAWMTQDVAYIMSDEERRAFKALLTDEEREHFSEQFWLRRDPTPGTVENEYKQEHYRRIAYANEHFGDASLPGWKTDRGRIYIIYGPPDEIESHPHGGPAPQFPAYPFEQWRYRYIQGVGNDVVMDFADPTGSGEYRMTTDPRAIIGAKKSGATVQISAGTALISIPLSRFAGHPVSVVGRIASQSGRVMQVFEAPIEGPLRVFTRSVALPAGSYRLQIGVKDNTTGAAFDDTFAFDVK